MHKVKTLERDVIDILLSQSKRYTNYIHQHWVQSSDSQFYLLMHFWNLVPMCWGMDVLVCGTCLWLYWYVAPVYVREENRALDSFLYYFLPWHRFHTRHAHFWSWLSSRGWQDLPVCSPITGVFLCHTFYVGLRIRTQVLMTSCRQSKSSYHGDLSVVLLGRFPYWFFSNYLYPYMLFIFIFCYARTVPQVKWG